MYLVNHTHIFRRGLRIRLIRTGRQKNAFHVALCGAVRLAPLPEHSGNSRFAPTPDSARRAERTWAAANPRKARKSSLDALGMSGRYSSTHSTPFSPASPQESPSLDELAGLPASDIPLAERGADVNAKAASDDTPLDAAIQERRAEMRFFLRRYGGRRNTRR